MDSAVSRDGRGCESERCGHKPWIHEFILTCTKTVVRQEFLPYMQAVEPSCRLANGQEVDPQLLALLVQMAALQSQSARHVRHMKILPSNFRN